MSGYRNLPPVEPVPVPSRFSQTLVAKHDDCPRSAYLYAKHKGGPGSHEMDRGTLAHVVFERALKTLIAQGERRFSPEAASIMAAIVDEVLCERPDLVVPRREVDDVREMAFHWAVGYDVDPEHVAGIERLMVLDLECGWTISGKLDVIALPSLELGQVDDYKSSQHVLTQEEYDGKTQPWVYAALLCFGVVVDRAPCAVCAGERAGPGRLTVQSSRAPFAADVIECSACRGKGYLEVRGEQIGGHLKGVLCREVYPRPKLRDDGLLHHREILVARTAVADYRADLERMAATLAARFESWDFPARSGSWCSTCPAAQECPLPDHLRDYAGTINTVDQAEEAWEKAQLVKAQLAAVEREVKNFCKAHDVPIRVGDLEWRWEPSEGRALRRAGKGSDWDGLEAAIREAVEFGVPFDVTEWVKPTVSNGFRKTKLAREVVA